MNIELLEQIFTVIIIPLLGILVTLLGNFIYKKSQALQSQVNNEIAQKYIGMLADTITTCVLSTKQTYVDSLKAQGAFNAEAQKEAFTKTKDAILLTLTQEAKEYLTQIYGDLNVYLDHCIEAEVSLTK